MPSRKAIDVPLSYLPKIPEKADNSLSCGAHAAPEKPALS
jgi:hypothetical protein